MKSLRHYSTAAVLLLCSSGFALAETGIPFHVSDNLVLTGAQEQLIRHLVPKPVSAVAATPSGFHPSLYGAVPLSVALRPLPSVVTGQIPIMRPYQYATLGGLLLIVNPSDRTIVDIIRP